MNCQNCGGPLAETSSFGRMLCQYCLTINLVEADKNTLDRVVILGQLGEYSCPCCFQHLTTAKIDEHQVEFCSKCQGVLANREVFTRIVWQRRANYRGADEYPAPPHPEELKARRNCPGCTNVMETYRYYGPGNAVIDACQDCQFIWLDGGELTVLERAPGQRQLVYKNISLGSILEKEKEVPGKPLHPLLELAYMIYR